MMLSQVLIVVQYSRVGTRNQSRQYQHLLSHQQCLLEGGNEVGVDDI